MRHHRSYDLQSQTTRTMGPRTNWLSCFCLRNTPSWTGDDEVDEVVGISLVSETLHDNEGLVLGLVQVSTTSDLTVANFRTLLVTQLPTLPVAFNFLTKNQWPVLIHQESTLLLKHILNADNLVLIQRFYDKPRIGIKTRHGTAIGFIYSDCECCLNTVRNLIFNQLGHVTGPVESSYQFLDSNGWPVGIDQEGEMILLDILSADMTIRICCEIFSKDQQSPSSAVSSDEGGVTPSSTGVITRGGKKKTESATLSPSTMLRQPTFRTGKDVDRRRSLSVESGESQGRLHQMLISYVRAEAAAHALDLKKALTAEGFSVYLDVHEIKTGIDWQDALNYAVSNCEMFLPLVTPRYGETQWTNREVKLADYLGKFIVPVSFLDYWPPPCLAIQFATTQYVPCDCNKKTDTDGDILLEGSTKSLRNFTTGSHMDTESDPSSKRVSIKSDVKIWDWRNIKSVAKEIGERYRVQLRKLQARPLRLTRRPSSLRSRVCSMYLDGPGSSSLDKQDEQPLIIISVHPRQTKYALTLRDWLEHESYEVWCSINPDDEVQFKSDDLRQLSSQEDGLSPPSQQSVLSVSSDDASGEHQLKRLIFQQKADDAAVVIFILSQDFAKSKTSQQQVFYCEHRKRVVPLKVEDFGMPGWMSMLIGTSTFEDARCEGYKESLLSRIKKCLDPKYDPEERNEAKINRDVLLLKKALPQGESMCIYVSGSTKFYFERSEEICKAIGENLARLDFVTIVTGGFYGVGEVVARSFLEARLVKPCDCLWHVVPRRDEKDRRHQARQNADRTFQRIPFGKTVYSGDSVRDREKIISRAIDLCLLIEGGPGAAHEAEQFAWNDHHVIPVKCTGGAASGKFKVPEMIFDLPQGVSAEDWLMLDNRTASAAEIGQAVMKIVSCLRMTLKLYKDGATIVRKRKWSSAKRISRHSSGWSKTFVIKENH